jgi:hypothetical protein
VSFKWKRVIARGEELRVIYTEFHWISTVKKTAAFCENPKALKRAR